jgi:hypothetical protein
VILEQTELMESSEDWSLFQINRVHYSRTVQPKEVLRLRFADAGHLDKVSDQTWVELSVVEVGASK